MYPISRSLRRRSIEPFFPLVPKHSILQTYHQNPIFEWSGTVLINPFFDDRLHQRGEKTSTNPIASIFAWTRGLAHRARLDNNPDLAKFCQALEAACVDCVDSGKMTKDLAICIHGMKGTKEGMYLHTEDFMEAVEEDMKKKFAKL